mgnify:CR=1 FL=1
MILEHALLPVIPGRESAFEEAFAQARPLIEAAHGCRGVQLHRSGETPNEYVLLVQWDTIADHTDGFRGSPAYAQWRALLHHFYDPFPTVEHFVEVQSARS